jgi:hypothetical protein
VKAGIGLAWRAVGVAARSPLEVGYVERARRRQHDPDQERLHRALARRHGRRATPPCMSFRVGTDAGFARIFTGPFSVPVQAFASSAAQPWS